MRRRLHRRRGLPYHEAKNKADVDKYGRQALEKNIADAISVYHIGKDDAEKQ